MRRSLLVVGVCMVAGLATFGCGGSGSSSGSSTNIPPGSTTPTGPTTSANAVFAGNYVGSFTASNGDTGEFAVSISSMGEMAGRYIDETGLTSKIFSSGLITFGSTTAAGSSGGVTLTDSDGTAAGTLTLLSGTLTGSLTNSAKSITFNFTSGLTSTASGNSFAGYYNGTFTYNGSAGTSPNTMAMIVDGGGNITSLLVNNVAGSTGTNIYTGTIVTTTGAASISPTSSPTTVTSGTLALAGGTGSPLTGSLVNSTTSPTITIVPSVNPNS